ncbi:MAG: glycoside hydrolase family 27 protein [Bacteroidales bacterium]|nr:glycoside hydrolase family 27 protein [Bacteroidales bacterium]
MKPKSNIRLSIIVFLFFIGLIIRLDCSIGQSFESLSPTPPMGWNSWNKFGCNVNEAMIKEMADAMVNSGMKDAGYEYIVIDDCWQTGRDSDGNIIPDPERFPSGMKALADYIHSKGLKFGLYSCAGSKTCQGRPGSRGYQFQDARQYAAWGVDYLKYDWCYDEGQDAKAAYKTMSDALKECGRPIVFSICEWGDNKPWKWGKGIGHLWRTTADIRDCFDCSINWGGLGVLQILDKQAGLEEHAGPGHWNDPDMLEIGNGGQTITEYKTHFSLWCMLAAPLMAGNDLRKMDDSIRMILTNKEAIAINQDKLGMQGFKFIDYGDLEIWVKALSDGDAAFCFLNRSSQPVDLDFNWKKMGIHHFSVAQNGFNLWKNEYHVKDLWNNDFTGTSKENLKHRLAGHEALLVRLSNGE